MTVNGIAGGLSGAITPVTGSGGHGHGGGASPGDGVGGGLGTGGSGGGSAGPASSSGGVTFGTYISFTNYGSTPWIYSPPSTQGSASTAAFPTSLSSAGGASPAGGQIEALQNRITQMRTALLSAFVQFVQNQSMQLLMPNVPGQLNAKRNLTISLQIAPPTAAAVQQAYQPTTTPSGTILSIVA